MSRWTVVMIYVAVKSNIKQTSGLLKDAFSSFPALGFFGVRHSTVDPLSFAKVQSSAESSETKGHRIAGKREARSNQSFHSCLRQIPSQAQPPLHLIVAHLAKSNTYTRLKRHHKAHFVPISASSHEGLTWECISKEGCQPRCDRRRCTAIFLVVVVVVVQAILDHQQLAASVGGRSAEFAVSLSRMSQVSTFESTSETKNTGGRKLHCFQTCHVCYILHVFQRLTGSLCTLLVLFKGLHKGTNGRTWVTVSGL